jgi:hypothetical protein
MTEKLTTGLDLLRKPFPANQISKLPKPTKAQTDAVKADFKTGIRCKICGGWHHPQVVHLDYVGHAALTDRLLDYDPGWTWEPLALGADGLPVIDRNGGLWIRLTAGGITRLGYGHADGKPGGDAIKEAIGDALRNAAMRFGAALDLWHKGNLHLTDDVEPATAEYTATPRNEAPAYVRADVEGVIAALAEAASAAEVADVKAKAKGLIFWCQAEMVPWFNELRAAFAKAQEFFATSEGEAAE